MKDSRIVFLQGPRVYLGSLEEVDAPLLAKWINNPQLREYMQNYMPKSIANEKEWVRECNGADKINLGIHLCENEQLIGTIGLHHINWRSRVAATGSLIGEERYRNKGLGFEAKMILLDYAFNCLNFRKICSSVFATNGRSKRYSEKCGYREEARLKEQHFVNGQHIDEIRLAVFRENWLPLWEKFKQENNIL